MCVSLVSISRFVRFVSLENRRRALIGSARKHYNVAHANQISAQNTRFLISEFDTGLSDYRMDAVTRQNEIEIKRQFGKRR